MVRERVSDRQRDSMEDVFSLSSRGSRWLDDLNIALESRSTIGADRNQTVSMHSCQPKSEPASCLRCACSACD